MTQSISRFKTAIKTTRDDHLIAWFTALAIAIHVIESSLPSLVPGIKPGLANIVIIFVLCQYGIRLAAWVMLMRVLVGSILLGTFLSPTFVLSFSGAISTLLALLLATTFAKHVPAWKPGPVGYSLLAALAHISAQFFVAYTLFIPHAALLNLLPALLAMSLVFGLINGLIVSHTISRA